MSSKVERLVFGVPSEVVGGVNGVERSKLAGSSRCNGVCGDSHEKALLRGVEGLEAEFAGDSKPGVPGFESCSACVCGDTGISILS